MGTEKADGVGPRPVFFESHIRPMFRLIDRDHMLYLVDPSQALDLHDYAEVKRKAQAIVRWLEKMPPVRSGGPWPEEWVSLFKRWVDEGCRDLQRSTGTYTAARSGDMVVLTITGAMAQSGEQAWLERFSDSENPRIYHLVREPGSDAPAPKKPIIERFPAGPDVQVVIIVDANGEHQVAIQGAAVS